MFFRHDNQTKAAKDTAADIRLGNVDSNDFLVIPYFDLFNSISHSIILRVILAYHGPLLVLEE